MRMLSWLRKGVSMKFGWLAVLAVVLVAGQAHAGEKATLKTKKDKISYIIGLNIGTNLVNQHVDVDADAFARGFRDGINRAKPAMSTTEMHDIMTAFNKELREKRGKEMKKLAVKNEAEGKKFLAANKKKKGVVTLPSGLQYKVIKRGKGKSPTINDVVTVNYRGTLIDGKVFDSSYKRGKPATFPVKGVIKGWTEALQLMKPGAKWDLYLPPQLAYGSRGAGGMIGPESTLIFEVELLSIKKGGH